MIKPEFFDDPSIGELSLAARLFFIGLWTQADREGRLKDDMRRLKVRIFPYDTVDVELLAAELHGKNMICRYSGSNGQGFMWIRNFTRHQRPHPKEPASVIQAYQSESLQAVEKQGEPCKETASKPESGVLSLDSGVRTVRRIVKGKSTQERANAHETAYQQFVAAYPVSRRAGGQVARRAFANAMRGKDQETHLTLMLAALEQQKQSEQWQNSALIPLMTTWLNQERWLQTLPPAAGQDSAEPKASGPRLRYRCEHQPGCDTRAACVRRQLDEGKKE